MIEPAVEHERRPPSRGVLVGRSILLAASVPRAERAGEYRRIEHAQLEIEQAIISLARAVFAEGGTLVFGGHPTLAPLVALVAGEYLGPRRAERAARTERIPDTTDPWRAGGRPPVALHQLSVLREALSASLRPMEQLGQASVCWHDTDAAEARQPLCAGELPYPRSLRAMRMQMLRDPSIAALVCIGGMEGVEEEAEMFAAVAGRRPIYALASTGGAAALLADRARGAARIIDRELCADLRPRLRRGDGELIDAPLRHTPYPFIMQAIVHEVGSRSPERGA